MALKSEIQEEKGGASFIDVKDAMEVMRLAIQKSVAFKMRETVLVAAENTPNKE